METEQRVGSSPAIPVQPLHAVEGVVRALEAGPRSRGELASALDLRSESGYFASKLISARAYGAVRNAEGRYELTELGRRLLSRRRAEAELAYREALAFSPPFELLRQGLDDDTSPEAIRAALSRAGVPESKVSAAQAAFCRSLERLSYLPPAPDAAHSPDAGGGEAPPEATPSQVQKEAGAPRHPDHDAFERLMVALPAPGTRTTLAERVKWTRIFAGLLELTYPGDGVIDVTGTQGGCPPR